MYRDTCLWVSQKPNLVSLCWYVEFHSFVCSLLDWYWTCLWGNLDQIWMLWQQMNMQMLVLQLRQLKKGRDSSSFLASCFQMMNPSACMVSTNPVNLQYHDHFWNYVMLQHYIGHLWSSFRWNCTRAHCSEVLIKIAERNQYCNQKLPREQKSSWHQKMELITNIQR